MSKPRLIIDYTHDGYRLSWFFPDDADIGGSLGEETYSTYDVALAKTKNNADDRECAIATYTAGKAEGVSRVGGAYVWETKTGAQAALRAVKAALAADRSEKPWPAWAVTAKAAGWKAPKGWTP